jgi:hypothetical protein
VLGVASGVRQADDSAPRVGKQVNLLHARAVADVVEITDLMGQVVAASGRLRRAAGSALIVADDGAATAREGIEALEVVARQARTSVKSDHCVASERAGGANVEGDVGGADAAL